MIIFFDKKTGQVLGTINGRIHAEAQLKAWVGDKNTTDRIICQWKPVKDYKNEKGDIVAQDFSPDSNQPDLFVNLDKNPSLVYNMKVDTRTKSLVNK